ncbi:MAG: tail fiber protein [Myxococcota bacterium]
MAQQENPDTDVTLHVSREALHQLAGGGTLHISETRGKLHLQVSPHGAQTEKGHTGAPHTPWGLLAAVGLAVCTMASIYAYADSVGEPPVARLLPYEGVLELDGAPVNTSVEIAFSLYDSPTDSANPIWSETQQEVQVVGGRFAVVLGEESAIPRVAFESRELYLGMSVNGTPLANRQQIYAGASSVTTAHHVPVGTVVAFAGQVAPRGWLLCNGANVSRTTYPALFAAIGTTHGAGTNASSFRLPDFRGRFLRGVDGGSGRDPEAASRQAARPGGLAGNQVGSVQGASTALPNTHFATGNNNRSHSHTFGVHQGTFGGGGGAAGLYTPFPLVENRQTSQANQSHVHTVLSGGDAETRPVNVNVHWIIKY